MAGEESVGSGRRCRGHCLPAGISVNDLFDLIRLRAKKRAHQGGQCAIEAVIQVGVRECI